MDFGEVEVFVSRLEVSGVKVCSLNRQYRLIMLGGLIANSRQAELGKLNQLEAVGRVKFAALLRISITTH